MLLNIPNGYPSGYNSRLGMGMGNGYGCGYGLNSLESSGYNIPVKPASLSEYSCRKDDNTAIKVLAVGALAVAAAALIFGKGRGERNGLKLWTRIKNVFKKKPKVAPEVVNNSVKTVKPVKTPNSSAARVKITPKLEGIVLDLSTKVADNSIALKAETLTKEKKGLLSEVVEIVKNLVTSKQSKVKTKIEASEKTNRYRKEPLALPPHVDSYEKGFKRLEENIKRNEAKNPQVSSAENPILMGESTENI